MKDYPKTSSNNLNIYPLDSNVSSEELLELKNKVNEYEEEKEKLLKEMKELRDEKNIVKMVNKNCFCTIALTF